MSAREPATSSLLSHHEGSSRKAGGPPRYTGVLLLTCKSALGGPTDSSSSSSCVYELISLSHTHTHLCTHTNSILLLPTLCLGGHHYPPDGPRQEPETTLSFLSPSPSSLGRSPRPGDLTPEHSTRLLPLRPQAHFTSRFTFATASQMDPFDSL